MEQARGDDAHNIVSVVMHELGVDPQGAFDWVGQRFRVLSQRFREARGALPPAASAHSPGGVRLGMEAALEADVVRYVEGLANWVRAKECWCFETDRYFGKEAPEVQRTRRVELLPKVE